MICPQCKAEYRLGFTRCTDCGVDLVDDPESDALALHEKPTPGDPNEDPFCSFWKGDDPRVHAELCALLDEAGIPHNTVFRSDHLFNLRNYSAFEVGVPFSLYQKAEQAVKEAYGDGTESFGADSQDRRYFPPMPALLTPSREENIPGPSQAYQEGDWNDDQATVRIWSSQSGEPTRFVLAALHENRIHCRVDDGENRAAVHVLPEEEDRAREIVREVVEGRPPE